jgi:hypothetical protein
MAVTHSTNARDVATSAVTALLNASGAGKLVFRTAGNITVPGTAVATLTFSATAFGASSSGTATANAITSDTNAAGGTVATATLQTGAAVVVIHCAVAASGSDINLTNGLTVSAGDTVSCSSLTYTALNA